MSARVETPFEIAAAFVSGRRAAVTLPVRCELGERLEARVHMGSKVVQVDEPAALGGGGSAPTPGQYALVALAACEALTLRYWSDRLGIAVAAVEIEVEGDIDLRGMLGLGDGLPPGYRAVRVTVRLSGPESPERYERLWRAADEHSAVLDVFRREVPVRTALEVREPGAG